MISVKYSRGADPCEGKKQIKVYYGSTKDNVCNSPISTGVYVDSTSSILQDVADDGQGMWTASDCNVCAPTGWYMDQPPINNGIAYYFDGESCYIVDSSICNREAIWVRTSPSASKLCDGVGTLYNVYTDSENFSDATGMWANGINNTTANVPSAQWYSVATYSGDKPGYLRYWTTDLDGGAFGSTEICQPASTAVQMQLELYNMIESTSSYLEVSVDGTAYTVEGNGLGDTGSFVIDVEPSDVVQITAKAVDNNLNGAELYMYWYDDESGYGESQVNERGYSEMTFDYTVPWWLGPGYAFSLYIEAY